MIISWTNIVACFVIGMVIGFVARHIVVAMKDKRDEDKEDD